MCTHSPLGKIPMKVSLRNIGLGSSGENEMIKDQVQQESRINLYLACLSEKVMTQTTPALSFTKRTFCYHFFHDRPVI